MNELLNLLISDELIKKIIELSDEYDQEYFVDKSDINARVKYIKKNLIKL